ncbi:hypothetical protein FACS1894113_3980 [Alphaproteobacteria bacterium]|nr:hypothetical protein FACS1894113_3980 [Alphaproteobacteria bacterium]
MPTTSQARVLEQTAVSYNGLSDVSDEEIMEEVAKAPPQLQAQMSIMQLKTAIAWRKAIQSVLKRLADKEKIPAEDKKKCELVAKRAISKQHQEQEVQKMITPDSLKKYYSDEFWPKHGQGKEQCDIKACNVKDLAMKNEIEKTVYDEDSLDKFLETHHLKSIDMKNQFLDTVPPEIAKYAQKGKLYHPVGIELRPGVFIVFVVTKVSKAEKQKDLSPELELQMRKMAHPDFTNKFILSICELRKVKFFGFDGKDISCSKIFRPGNILEQDAKSVDLTNKKDSDVIAEIDGKKVTVKEIKDHYDVDSLVDDKFLELSAKSGSPLEEVVLRAIGLYVFETCLVEKMEKEKYFNSPDVQKQMEQMKATYLIQLYVKKTVNVTTEEIKKQYLEWTKMIPDEVKNSFEISTKSIFFDTKEDASNELKKIISNELKFDDLFTKMPASAIELQFRPQNQFPNQLSTIFSKTGNGTCCTEVAEWDGAELGFPGKKFAITKVLDKRKFNIPVLEQVQPMCKTLAQHKKVTALILQLFKNLVISIYDFNVASKSDEEISQTICQILPTLLGEF